MDPLTALGLASNIIQLISFTSDLVAKGREIYSSADGGLVQNLELETIAKSLKNLTHRFPLQLEEGSLSKTDRELRELCNACNEVSRELIGVVHGLKVDGGNRKWTCFRQALRSVWREDKIQALSKRLEGYRRQLDTTLLISLREQLHEDRRLTSNIKELSSRGGSEMKPWHSELLNALRQHDWEPNSQQDMAAFSLNLSACTKDKRERMIKAHILQQLRFTNMGDRYERIEDAYRKTFDWAFETGDDLVFVPGTKRLTADGTKSSMLGATTSPKSDHISQKDSGSNLAAAGDLSEHASSPNRSSFIHWLGGEEGVFWITGKPGSGKSTLMKYLYNKPKTLENLQTWCRGHPLSTAGFFFWNSGTVMQMSKMGLLQALIYESEKDNFDIIPILFPERWRSYALFGGDLRPWTWSELAFAFERLLSDESRKFFFVIDGLDEFDGDCTELANFILQYSERSNVKMCVASRPWLVFEDSFKRQPSLRLEDLTAPDIRLFVSEKLRENHMFVFLERLQPQDARQLVLEVTGKASGVFLWVRLVLLSLLEGLQDGDSITDLHERLRLLPPDLEDLFRKILGRLNPSYFAQASKLFQLVSAAEEPLSLLVLSYAEDGFDTAMAAEIQAITDAQAGYRAERMRRRLNSRCQGLLEAPIYKHKRNVLAEVQYLHRTVKDFLKRPDIWAYIVSGGPYLFDPDKSLFGAFLLHIKSLSLSPKLLELFRVSLTWCIEYAKRFETAKGEVHIKALEQVDQAAGKLFGQPHPDGGTWLSVIGHNPSSRETLNAQRHWATLLYKPGKPPLLSYFDYAFQSSLHSFIEHELICGRDVDSLFGGNTLLYVAVVETDLRMIDMLLRHGANPNFHREIQYVTPWMKVLELINHRSKYSTLMSRDITIELEANIVASFLRHNADPWFKFENRSVEALIQDRFQAWDADRTDELLHLLAVLMKTRKDPTNPPSRIKILFKKLSRASSKPMRVSDEGIAGGRRRSGGAM